MDKIKLVLFDLDGTLLPMDQSEFMRAYFGLLSKAMESRGYEPKAFIEEILRGTAAMMSNDGSYSNETVFWNSFCKTFGEDALKEEPFLESFYKTEFELVKNACGFDPEAARAVKELRALGKRVVLATNPLFPEVATRARIRWAGLSYDDFEFVTTYENSSFTKPNLSYYKQISEKLGVAPSDCLMVGNDVGEDMIAEELGMSVFLIDKCLINKVNKDISQYPRGDFSELLRFVSGK